MFQIFYSNQAKKFLRKLDKINITRILNKIEDLSNNPFISDIKRVKGKNLLRIRIGSFRVLYEIDYKEKIIGVVRINKRPRVYD